MSGIAGLKFTFSDLKKLAAYAMENAVEPKTIESKTQAGMFNKRDRLMASALGLKVYHTWQVGDRYYELPIKAKDEEQLPISQGTLGVGLGGYGEVEPKFKGGKQNCRKHKKLSKVDGARKLKRKSNKNWKVIQDD
jgi:lambda repressor-like predicted transcriptional regulator